MKQRVGFIIRGCEGVNIGETDYYNKRIGILGPTINLYTAILLYCILAQVPVPVHIKNIFIYTHLTMSEEVGMDAVLCSSCVARWSPGATQFGLREICTARSSRIQHVIL